jgi:hypothetical protein
MAHFAQLDENNIVVYVVVGRQEDEGKENELSERTGHIYKQTSYNTIGGIHYNPETNQPSEDQSKAFRKNYAGLGYTYDQDRDAFIPPKPFDSWSLDEESCLWIPPIPKPDDGAYAWNEKNKTWEKI